MRFDIPVVARHKVTAAIKKAERRTSGEIVVIAARQSDDYIHVPLHIAAALALAVPFVLPLLARFFPWTAVSLFWVFLVQLVVFIVVAVILSFAPLRYYVTPKRLMHKYAHANAASQFLAVNLHGTDGRTGVLVFVSLLERYCEIIGDTAISSKVGRAEWQSIIDDILPIMHGGNVSDGLAHAVERCGEVLAKHFPPGAPNPNELPDHFIVLG
jgi:putative membrane protein